MNISNQYKLKYDNGSIQKVRKHACKINKINEYICDVIMSTSLKTSAIQNTKIHAEELSKFLNENSFHVDNECQDSIHKRMYNVPTSTLLKNHHSDPEILKAVMLLWETSGRGNFPKFKNVLIKDKILN